MEKERVVLLIKECEDAHFLTVRMLDVVRFSHSFDRPSY